ncbi:MAG: tetratricopeptide repeat protein [Ekhidna sp.]
MANLNKAIEIRKKEGSTSSIDYSHNLFYLSKTLLNKGELKQALELGIQSLNIRKKHLRPYHPTISNSLSDIGDVYRRLGNFDEALAHYLPALEIRKRSLGDKHVNVGASYYTIGNLYGNMFNYSRAIHYLGQGNLIIEEKLGESLPVLHTYYAYLGRMYGKIGRDKEAVEMLSKALNLAEKHLDDTHPYLGIIYNIAGEYYGEKDSVDTQVSYLRKAQKIYQVAYGEDHPREADVLIKLGEASFKQKDMGQSMKLYERALSIVESKNGKWNSETGGIYQYMGDWCLANQEYDIAQDYFLKSIRAVSIDTTKASRSLSFDQLTHPQLALRSTHKLAKSFDAQYANTKETKQLLEALKYYTHAIDLAYQISSDYQLEVSKAQLANETRTIFQDVIGTTYKLYTLTSWNMVLVSFANCALDTSS